MSLHDHYAQAYEGEEAARVPPRPPVPIDRFSAARLGLPGLLPPAPAILELGAGSGLVALSLIEDGLTFSRYVASEIPGPRLALLERTMTPLGVEVAEIDADALPAEWTGFDAVLMIALIEHLLDPIEAMRAIGKALKPGGFVWIDTPNIARVTRRIKLALGRFPSTASMDEGLRTFAGEPVNLYDEGHLHYWTFRSLERMLIELCGFTRVERMPYASAPFPTGRASTVAARRMPTLISELCVAAYV